MSVEGIAVPWGQRRGDSREPGRRGRFLEIYEKFSPSQGWASLIFLLITLFVVGDSITSAAWVETPGLSAILFFSALIGLGLSKVRIPAVFLHPLGILLGPLVALWQASTLVEDESTISARFQEIWMRLNIWYEAATSDGLSTDALPLALGILVMAWLLGYFSSWFIFRSNNAWVAVVIGGTAMLTNLSFLPDRFAPRFFLFTFFAMLLIVRMSIIQRHEIWRGAQTRFSTTGGWLLIHSTVWFSVAVLVLAAILPMNVYVSRFLADIWEAGRSPIENLEDDFARLFSGVPSKKNVSGRFFGSSLPFLGAISFGGEVVFWADTDYPSYWLSQTYSEYTPQGWKAGKTSEIEVGPDIVPPPRSDVLKREKVEQSLQLNFDSSDFLSGGSLDWISRGAVVGALAPKQFRVDLLDASKDSEYPKDIRELAAQLREELSVSNGREIDTRVSNNLPDDLVVKNIASKTDSITGALVAGTITLERKEPITPEIVGWEFEDELEANHVYSMVSFVSLASDDDLRETSTDYNRFITDHYLQLPSTLPQRIRDLSAELTKNAHNPLDKALAIQNYLRKDGGFVYSQDIEAPPLHADGVDFFLFETKTGYSDYFASAMTVMLRSVGVPARLAAGYAPGEYVVEQERRVVRDSDSHGWVQVHFPEYGWIDFEPTPNWPAHERKFLTGPGADDTPGRITGDAETGDFESFDPFLEDELFDANFSAPGFDTRSSIDFVQLGVRSAIGFGAAAFVWLVLYTLWNTGLVSASPVEKAYTKMTRLGAFAGVRRRSYQTPIEYAGLLGDAIPTIRPQAQSIAYAFASDRYAANKLPDADQHQMEETWKKIRGELLVQALKRLIPFGGTQL